MTDTTDDLSAFGWAPGLYSFQCRDCHSPNRCGEKRSYRCRACALAAKSGAQLPAKCDDAEVMRVWREVGLPEYFLGNGGTNYKLVAFANRCARLAMNRNFERRMQDV